MIGKAESTRIKSLLTEAITMLCKSGLSYKSEFCIEGLLGITLDKEDILLVNINEVIQEHHVFESDIEDEALDNSAVNSPVKISKPLRLETTIKDEENFEIGTVLSQVKEEEDLAESQEEELPPNGMGNIIETQEEALPLIKKEIGDVVIVEPNETTSLPVFPQQEILQNEEQDYPHTKETPAFSNILSIPFPPVASHSAKNSDDSYLHLPQIPPWDSNHPLTGMYTHYKQVASKRAKSHTKHVHAKRKKSSTRQEFGSDMLYRRDNPSQATDIKPSQSNHGNPGQSNHGNSSQSNHSRHDKNTPEPTIEFTEDMAKHILSEPGVYRCALCNYLSRRRYNIQRHFLHKHSTAEPKFLCDICDKKFHLKTSLKQHYYTHTKQLRTMYLSKVKLV